MQGSKNAGGENVGLSEMQGEKTQEFYYIGPESRVYHTRQDCSLLNNNRYWPIHRSKTVPSRRRLCKACEKYHPPTRKET